MSLKRVALRGKWTKFALISCLFIILIFSISSIVPFYQLENILINQRILSVPHHLTNDILEVQGRTQIQTQNVTFLGVGKNIGKHLPNILLEIEQFARYFAMSQAIFVESDSSDNTLSIFRRWSKVSPSNRTILSFTSIEEFEKYDKFRELKLPREGRISMARNLGLETYFKNKIDTTYLIVVDLDIVGWDHSSLLRSFTETHWDVRCASGVLLHGLYRDTYAFRMAGVNTNHHMCGSDYHLYNMTPSQVHQNRIEFTRSKSLVQRLMSHSEVPFQVESCFGGLAIYKTEIFKKSSCRYDYRHSLPPFMLECEHVLLHECLRGKGARVVADPKMRLWYGHNPLSPSSILKYLRGKIRSIFI